MFNSGTLTLTDKSVDVGVVLNAASIVAEAAVAVISGVGVLGIVGGPGVSVAVNIGVGVGMGVTVLVAIAVSSGVSVAVEVGVVGGSGVSVIVVAVKNGVV